MKLFFAFIFSFLSAFAAMAQNTRPITGKITSAETWSPLPAVTVRSFASGKTFITDTLGNFTCTGITVPDTLIITSIGYNSLRVPVTIKTALPLALVLVKSGGFMLDSVTVYNTGYQYIRRPSATGSFTQMDNKTINRQVGTNILSRLEGVTGSVAFNKKGDRSPAISVRGLSTINGPTSPLIILDNFPYEGDINAINPNMIESVTILKDAAAAAIWGTKAGNGVIVINTKKATFGQPFTVDFNSTIQVYSKPNLFYNNAIAPADFIDVERWLYGKGYFNSAINDPYHPAISPVVELLDRQSRGLITAPVADAQIAAMRNTDVRNDYNKYMYNNAVNQQYAINCSGGSAQMNWLAAGGYDRNLSELSAKYQRINTRLQIDFKPAKNLRVTTGLFYGNTVTASGKTGYPDQAFTYPYSRLIDDNGNPVPAAKDFRPGFTDTVAPGKYLDWNYYPADDYKHRYTDVRSNNLLANLSLQYQLPAGFSLDLKYQYESQWAESNAVSDDKSYQSRYYINLFSQINPTTGIITYKVPKGGILDMSNSTLKVNNFRAQLNYNKKFNKHQLTALAGAEVREARNWSSSSRVYGYDPQIKTAANADLTNQYPTFPFGDPFYIPGGNPNFDDQLKRFVSYYGNAAYNYNNKYSLSLSGRRDASNLFGVNTNSKWTPLWSAGAGWDINKEKFYHSNILPYLRVKATYGFTGNADPSRSAVVTLNYTGNSLVTNFPLASIKQFPNPGLRWERVAITNIGVDFATKSNRLSCSIEWYLKKGTGLFGATQIDITAGLGQNSLVTNVASMKGYGWDITINSINTTGKIKWTSTLLFNYNTDKVTKAFISNTNASGFLSSGGAITALEGKPVHSVVSFKWAGLDHNTGNPQGYLNGVLSQDYGALTGSGTSISDLEFSGPGLPRFFGSLFNSVAFKRFDLDINISYKFQYFFKRKPLSYGNLYAAADKKSTADFARRWQQPGDEMFTDVHSMIYPLTANREFFYGSSAVVVEKGDHVRLQFINLSYTLPLLKAGYHPVSNIRFYVNASNLGILWRANKKGLDPDYALSDIPTSKAWAFGIKIGLR